MGASESMPVRSRTKTSLRKEHRREFARLIRENVHKKNNNNNNNNSNRRLDENNNRHTNATTHLDSDVEIRNDERNAWKPAPFSTPTHDLPNTAGLLNQDTTRLSHRGEELKHQATNLRGTQSGCSAFQVFIRKRPLFAHEATTDHDVVQVSEKNSTVTVYDCRLSLDERNYRVLPTVFSFSPAVPASMTHHFRGDSCDRTTGTKTRRAKQQQQPSRTQGTDAKRTRAGGTLGTGSSTDDVYERSVYPLVKHAIRGGNATAFLFGQTGSGKTYTFTGLCDRIAHDLFCEDHKSKPKKTKTRRTQKKHNKEQLPFRSNDVAMNENTEMSATQLGGEFYALGAGDVRNARARRDAHPHAAGDVDGASAGNDETGDCGSHDSSFDQKEQQEQQEQQPHQYQQHHQQQNPTTTKRHPISVSVSCVEVHGQQCIDLLGFQNSQVRILEDARGIVSLSGVQTLSPSSPQELLAIIDLAMNQRKEAETATHSQSSRTHMVCCIVLRSKHADGRLVLVDLAGSERRADSMDHNRARLYESALINTGLMALKQCMSVFARNQRIGKSTQMRIPYRAHTITRILKSSFTHWDARTVVIGTVSPASADTEHTIDTLSHLGLLAECTGGGGTSNGSIGIDGNRHNYSHSRRINSNNAHNGGHNGHITASSTDGYSTGSSGRIGGDNGFIVNSNEHTDGHNGHISVGKGRIATVRSSKGYVIGSNGQIDGDRYGRLADNNSNKRITNGNKGGRTASGITKCNKGGSIKGSRSGLGMDTGEQYLGAKKKRVVPKTERATNSCTTLTTSGVNGRAATAAVVGLKRRKAKGKNSTAANNSSKAKPKLISSRKASVSASRLSIQVIGNNARRLVKTTSVSKTTTFSRPASTNSTRYAGSNFSKTDSKSGKKAAVNTGSISGTTQTASSAAAAQRNTKRATTRTAVTMSRKTPLPPPPPPMHPTTNRSRHTKSLKSTKRRGVNANVDGGKFRIGSASWSTKSNSRKSRSGLGGNGLVPRSPNLEKSAVYHPSLLSADVLIGMSPGH